MKLDLIDWPNSHDLPGSPRHRSSTLHLHQTIWSLGVRKTQDQIWGNRGWFAIREVKVRIVKGEGDETESTQ